MGTLIRDIFPPPPCLFCPFHLRDFLYTSAHPKQFVLDDKYKPIGRAAQASPFSAHALLHTYAFPIRTKIELVINLEY